jgi:hypothetical protein
MRPCPFCHSVNIMITSRDTSQNARMYTRVPRQPKYQIRCTKCGARGPITRTEPEAWDAWSGERNVVMPLLD